MSFDVRAFRSHFSQLGQEIDSRPAVYFDNAATSLKPSVVTETIAEFYRHEVANIHRSAHSLGNRGTERYEDVRSNVAEFINATEPAEIIFTRGTTESLNLVAHSYAQALLNPGDEILLTEVEHHSNIVPWQIAAKKNGLILRVLPILDNGEWDLSQLPKVLTARTRLVAASHVSNVTGLIYPLSQLTAAAHNVGAVVVVDAAQSVTDIKIDVQSLDCDFLAFSGHKLFGPFGVGILYGKKRWLEQMPPYQSGGSMIADVNFSETTYLQTPYRFEAGTPNVAGVIGLGAALRFFSELGPGEAHHHKTQLRIFLEAQLKDISGLKLFGESSEKVAISSFLIEGCHSADIAQMLDQQGFAIRAGHLCAQPLMRRLGVSGLARVSLSVYNTRDEITSFVQALHKAKELLS